MLNIINVMFINSNVIAEFIKPLSAHCVTYIRTVIQTYIRRVIQTYRRTVIHT